VPVAHRAVRPGMRNLSTLLPCANKVHGLNPWTFSQGLPLAGIDVRVVWAAKMRTAQAMK